VAPAGAALLCYFIYKGILNERPRYVAAQRRLRLAAWMLIIGVAFFVGSEIPIFFSASPDPALATVGVAIFCLERLAFWGFLGQS